MPAFPFSAFRPFLGALPLAWLWFLLIRQLSVEWDINPQYAYAWAVPFLCAYLLWRKAAGGGRKAAKPISRFQSFSFRLLLVGLAGLWLPARLLQEANPQWRTGAWFIALTILGLTLCVLRLTLGSRPLRSEQVAGGHQSDKVPRVSPFSAFQQLGFSDFVFPLCFFLVAVPWPTVIEHPLIQGLTRADVGMTCEVAGWLGIPALAHGNVIEVATGRVDVDEACSGIRSFQATLMISLFLGELYALGIGRRVGLVAAGFFLAWLLNLARLTVLVWVAASRGVPAISRWHDPTGVVILLGCFCGLWAVGLWLARGELNRKWKTETLKRESGRQTTDGSNQRSEVRDPPSGLRSPVSGLPISVFALAAWIGLVEAGVETWFRVHESKLKDQPVWMVKQPSPGLAAAKLQVPEAVRNTLRFSEAQNFRWLAEDGTRWQVIFLRWGAGRIAAHLAQGHTPELCLPASGRKLLATSPVHKIMIQGLSLPFQRYELEDEDVPLQVFYCLWQDRAEEQSFESKDLFSLSSRLQGIWAGRRNLGQRSLEVAVWGIRDPVQAEAALRKQLESLIEVVPAASQ